MCDTGLDLSEQEFVNFKKNGIDSDCPNCGRYYTWYNSSGDLQCDNCGYAEE